MVKFLFLFFFHGAPHIYTDILNKIIARFQKKKRDFPGKQQPVELKELRIMYRITPSPVPLAAQAALQAADG
ncbi:MAG: hypothetical protein MSK39_11225 [Dysosmobacter sp.]|nr:hypothetical protein [Dysosmobacter sp.]